MKTTTQVSFFGRTAAMNISPSFGQSRRRSGNVTLSLPVIAMALGLIACGGGSSTPPPPPPRLSPSISSLSPVQRICGSGRFQIWLILKTWEVLRVATARIHRNPPAFIGLHDQNLTSHRPAAVH